MSPDAAGATGISSFEEGRWGTFRSRRFGLALALPEGRAWRIDDHRTHWLKATHAATLSSLLARVWFEPSPTSDERCYARAREWNREVPDLGTARIVDDHLQNPGGTGGLQFHVQVGLDETAQPVTENSSGFVIAAAAAVRKCIVVVFRTTSADGAELAARLAVISGRLISSLEIASPLEAPTGAGSLK